MGSLVRTVRCLSGGSVVGSCDLLWSSQLQQWYHRTGGALIACGFLPQLYSELAIFATRRTLHCGFRWLYLTWNWSVGKEGCCCCVLLLAAVPVLSIMPSVVYMHPHSSPCSQSTPPQHIAIRRVTFCWQVSYSQEKAPAAHSFPRHCLKIALSASNSHFRALIGPSLS